MAWKGFIKESKIYCDYDDMTPNEKLYWWVVCVFVAAPRFYYYGVQDFLIYQKNKLIYFMHQRWKELIGAIRSL